MKTKIPFNCHKYLICMQVTSNASLLIQISHIFLISAVLRHIWVLIVVPLFRDFPLPLSRRWTGFSHAVVGSIFLLLPARCSSGDSVPFSLFAMRSADTRRPGVTDFNSTAAGVCKTKRFKLKDEKKHNKMNESCIHGVRTFFFCHLYTREFTIEIVVFRSELGPIYYFGVQGKFGYAITVVQ